MVSYETKWSKGNRKELIKISCSSGLCYYGDDSISNLLDGSEEKNFYFNGGKQDQFILLDFKEPVCIKEIKLSQSSDYSHGKWKIQVSDDNKKYYDIKSEIDLNIGTFPIDNNNKYQYYKLQQIEGSTSGSPWIFELEFGIDEHPVLMKFIFEQDGKIYSALPEYYIKESNYKALDLKEEDITNEHIKKYGIVIADLEKEISVGDESFKPKDKLKLIGTGEFYFLADEVEI